MIAVNVKWKQPSSSLFPENQTVLTNRRKRSHGVTFYKITYFAY